MTSRQSQTLEPIQDKSKTLNPQAQINPNWLSKARPVNEGTVFAIPFFLRAVFCSFFGLKSLSCSFTPLQDTPGGIKWQSHTLQCWKNPNSFLTSAQKAFLLYLTFPVCASPQSGYQRKPPQQLLHLALPASKQRSTLKKQKHKQLQTAKTRSALLTCKEFASIHPPPLWILTDHMQKGRLSASFHTRRFDRH